MKKGIFKYKNNIYVLNDDIQIKKSKVLEDENGDLYNIMDYNSLPLNKTFILKEYFEIKKNYYTIDFFKTEKEAIEVVENIYNSLEQIEIEDKNYKGFCASSLI